jgi:hypothetical protein
VSIDLIWSVASFCACDAEELKYVHDGAKLGCGCGQAIYASGHNISQGGERKYLGLFCGDMFVKPRLNMTAYIDRVVG